MHKQPDNKAASKAPGHDKGPTADAGAKSPSKPPHATPQPAKDKSSKPQDSKNAGKPAKPPKPDQLKSKSDKATTPAKADKAAKAAKPAKGDKAAKADKAGKPSPKGPRSKHDTESEALTSDTDDESRPLQKGGLYEKHRFCLIDRRYCTRIPCFLKILEFMFCFFSLGFVTLAKCNTAKYVKEYFQLLGLGAIASIMILHLILLFTLYRFCKCRRAVCLIMEMIFYIVLMLLYAAGLTLLMSHRCDFKGKCACVFGLLAMLTFLTDIILCVIALHAERKKPHKKDYHEPATTPVAHSR